MLMIILYVVLGLFLWVGVGFGYLWVNLGKKSFDTGEPVWEMIVTGPAILLIMIVMQFSRDRK